MARIFKNPNLTDYFIERPDVTLNAPLEQTEPIVEAYEAGKVIGFPNLKLGIDHDLWASLSIDSFPRLKKFKFSLEDSEAVLRSRLRSAGLPAAWSQNVTEEIRGICERFIPLYERLFEGYRFDLRRVVWRLTTTMNEGMHIDTYTGPRPAFSRIFVNLDTQPRIWMTSYTIEEMFDRFGPQLSVQDLQTLDTDSFRIALNKVAFGPHDNQPRHVIYFDPGDVWAVDSRCISHQIFYGRRAASFDFTLALESMRDPNNHYLKVAENYRTSLLTAANT